MFLGFAITSTKMWVVLTFWNKCMITTKTCSTMKPKLLDWSNKSVMLCKLNHKTLIISQNYLISLDS